MSSRLGVWAIGFPLLAIVASCGGSEASLHSGASSGGSSSSGGDAGSFTGNDATVGHTGQACQSDGDCGAGGLCDPGSHTCGCGGTQVMAHTVAPNLLIVMDRSCSMQKPVGGMPKWTIAVQALTKLTQAYAGRIRFGLELFPGRRAANKCVVDSIAIPVDPASAGPIEQLLAASLTQTDPNYPSGPCVTPIDTAVAEAAADPALADATRGDFALLITDGQQAACNAGGGDPATIATLGAMHGKGVGTFVVGFGASVSVKSLDAFAQAGGEVNAAGPNAFYNAADQASLESALTAIAQSTLSCRLQLASSPPGGDPSLIYVYFDKTPPPVARDTTHAGGWDYDPQSNTVTFYGSACDELRTGKVTDAEVVFGCPGGGTPTGPLR